MNKRDPILLPGFRLGSPWVPSWPALVHPQGRSQRDAPKKEGSEDADAPLAGSSAAKFWETDPLFFGTLKGLGLNNSYSNTYDLWNISQISTEQTNKKVGYNHQVIDILATQDTV